jgi:UDP-N-acetyl-2-amino-2-deoxyglucuronate dehydrogenase
MINKVAIIGCGAIFNRHLESINLSKDFKLVAVCDIQKELVSDKAKKQKCKAYYSLSECIENSDANFYVLATPNYLHYKQAVECINSKKSVLIEKPVTLKTKELDHLIQLSKEKNVDVFGVLQVRLNNSVAVVKRCLEKSLVGKLRGVNLIQRWQRPMEYFSGWRSVPSLGGGTLHEVGIHYIDILQYLIGKPEIVAAKTYNTKHVNSNIEDTVYALLNFPEFGGNLEVTISAEPHNLECSISILGSNGFIKLGGKALNIIESYNFLSHGAKKEFEQLMKEYENVTYIPPNDYGSYLGSCPNHVGVYKNLEKFKIENSKNSLEIIENIYKMCGKEY